METGAIALPEVPRTAARRGDRTTLLVGELDNLHTERVRILPSHLPGAQVTERIGGCLWTGLARDAVLAAASVSDQPLAAVFATTQCLGTRARFAHPEVGDTRNPRDPSRPTRD